MPAELVYCLPKDDEVITRLKAIALLSAGWKANEVETDLRIDRETLFRLNISLSLCGVAGLLSDRKIENWLDRLSSDSGILRRLEMVSLLRSGTPVKTIADQHGAVEEYIERVEDRFSADGPVGIITESELQEILSLNPKNIKVCTYNLHGTHDDNPLRYRLIARGLSSIDPHLTAFQEALSGEGVEDTGSRIAQWASAITGYHYQSEFLYSHQFMEKYPEGVAVMARCQVGRARTIDLTHLGNGLSPLMARQALVVDAEVNGHQVVMASVHLDHHADEHVRLEQARKLGVQLYQEKEAPYCVVLAGDFNDSEDSPSLKHLRELGYRDAFRVCNSISKSNM
jgi:endonuclease/exonuclease/phosphatase family metal-dependent hydrolase